MLYETIPSPYYRERFYRPRFLKRGRGSGWKHARASGNKYLNRLRAEGGYLRPFDFFTRYLETSERILWKNCAFYQLFGNFGTHYLGKLLSIICEGAEINVEI